MARGPPGLVSRPVSNLGSNPLVTEVKALIWWWKRFGIQQFVLPKFNFMHFYAFLIKSSESYHMLPSSVCSFLFNTWAVTSHGPSHHLEAQKHLPGRQPDPSCADTRRAAVFCWSLWLAEASWGAPSSPQHSNNPPTHPSIHQSSRVQDLSAEWCGMVLHSWVGEGRHQSGCSW